jgi:hypothetical protein
MVGCREVTESFRRIRKVRTVGNLRKITMVMMVLMVMGWWGMKESDGGGLVEDNDKILVLRVYDKTMFYT